LKAAENGKSNIYRLQFGSRKAKWFLELL